MIETVRIRGFKRFEDLEFRFPGSVVLVGPNDSGKTTVLQAIAAWAFALRTWRYLDDFDPRKGFVKAPLGWIGFPPVPLLGFHQLWTGGKYRAKIEIEIGHRDGWTVAMEFHSDATHRVSVRPRRDADGELLRHLDFPVAFIPAMTGVEMHERYLQPTAVEQVFATGNPGQVLRSLLAATHHDDSAWSSLQEVIGRLFGYRLQPPVVNRPFLYAEYEPVHGGPRFDLSSAGTGFRQVVMLLALLLGQRNAVLLLDEPDAHLHVGMLDVIWRELRMAALHTGSQIIAATHSETLINALDPQELYLLSGRPRTAADSTERGRVGATLGGMSNLDLIRAANCRGVLYVEDYIDRDILRAWARVLSHPAQSLLDAELLWKSMVIRPGEGRAEVRAETHYDALLLAHPGLPGLELLDGDTRPETPETPISGTGLQRQRWRRYEIESYLFHPDALARFVEAAVGADAAQPAVEGLRATWRDTVPPALSRNPHDDDPLVTATARARLLPTLLAAADIHDLPRTRYHEIAALMRPEEIHPEVTEKLDAICQVFGRTTTDPSA